MNNTDQVNNMIRNDYNFLLTDMKRLVKTCQADIRSNPGDYTEHGTDAPSIDVRLCIDLDSWVIRTGSSDYDQRHSLYCGASSIDLDTKPEQLLEELIDQVMDQVYD